MFAIVSVLTRGGGRTATRTAALARLNVVSLRKAVLQSARPYHHHRQCHTPFVNHGPRNAHFFARPQHRSVSSRTSPPASVSRFSSPRSRRYAVAMLGLGSCLVALSLSSRSALAESPEDEKSSWDVFGIVSDAKSFWKKQGAPVRKQLLPSPPHTDLLGKPLMTVVINLEKTLMYSKYTRDKGWVHKKRPCADSLLSFLAHKYEVVIFSTKDKHSVVGMLQSIDPFNAAQGNYLFREHTTYENGIRIKDLGALGRDLSRVILLDSNPEAFSKHPDSGIVVKPYEQEDPDDRELCKLISFFEYLKQEDVDDVRDVIRNFEAFHARAEAKLQARNAAEKQAREKRKGWLW